MKCFYHNDNDGVFSAACVNVWGRRDLHPDKFVRMDYKDSFPIGSVQKDEQVYIVDFSIEPDMMLRLFNVTPNVVWIDHHKTAIEKYAGFPRDIEGIRRDGAAACELMWEWFIRCGRTQGPMPGAIRYVGDRDVWAWRHGDGTRFFHAGFGLQDDDPCSDLVRDLVTNQNPLADILRNGEIVEEYRRRFFEKYRRTYCFEGTFEGHRAVFLNIATVGSEAFGEDFDNYDIVIPFIWDGQQWTVSLYAETVDVGEIAKGYGGGGHRGAAGFQCKELPW